ncbi:organomercurial lyase [Halocatena pleomorpha]|nr:organomercurial lyase [Halocatena pleomorpha]
MNSALELDAVAQSQHNEQLIVDSQLPEEIQTRLARLFPEYQPTSFRDWINAWSEHLNLGGGSLSPDDLRATTPSPIESEIYVTAADGSVFGEISPDFHGVLVPIVISIVAGDSVGIEADCPHNGDEIALETTSDGVISTPSDVVISFGVPSDLADGSSIEGSEFLYDQLCSYAIPFSSTDAYENWADETTTATTVALSLEDTYDVALEAYRAAERRALSSSEFHCNCC